MKNGYLWIAAIAFVSVLPAEPAAAQQRSTASEASPVSTIPIDEIRPGMRGYGLTVFRGTRPERFDVEVIDVLHRFRPGMDLILVRTNHPTLEHAGTVAGMSGSPIYLDGRLAGAYAYGWAFGKDPVAGVTPIASMMDEAARPRREDDRTADAGAPPQARRGTAESDTEARWGEDALAAFEHALPDSAARDAGDAPRLVPAMTPLMLSGFSDRSMEYLRETLEPLGMVPMQAGGGQAENSSNPSPFQAGGAIGVQLVRGDISATAVGTITAVDGDTVLAFGHPMLNVGQTSLPTAASRVLHILASESRSFKLAEAISSQGAMVQDRQAAIVVDSSARATVVPVRVRINRNDGAPPEVWEMEIAEHRVLTPLLAFAVVQNAVETTVGDQAPAHLRARSRVVLQNREPIELADHVFSGLGPGNAGSLRRFRMFRVLEAAYRNPFEHAVVERIELDLDVVFGREVLEIVGASVDREEVSAGDTIPIRVRFRRFNSEPIFREVSLSVPADAAGETLEIKVEGGSTVPLETPLMTSLSDMLEVVTDRPASTTLVVSTKRPARGLRFQGHVLRDLPASALRTLQPVNDSGEGLPFVSVRRQETEMGELITGSAQVRLSVQERVR